MKLKIEDLPYYIDRWRIWPRAMITTYMWLIVYTALWFTGLGDPTVTQAGFASAIISAGAIWFGLYLQRHGAVKSTPEEPYDRHSGP